VLYFCTVFVIIFACFTVNATIKAHLSKKYLKKYEENAKNAKVQNENVVPETNQNSPCKYKEIF
jgi:hypothetical protein